jgi:hypothetical protein
MVERPIKKSERQPKVSGDNNSENMNSTPSVESTPKISKRSDDRSKDKRKKGAFAEESKQQVSPALARGPKPVKPQASIKTEPETEPETESEAISEESQD